MYALDPQLQQDTVQLGQFPLCDVLLMNDANFPWVILVPRRSRIREIFHLSSEEQHQLMDESVFVSQRMADFYEADKMNVAALGNVVPQLHVHHVVRRQNDLCWPKPIWGAVTPKPYADSDLKAMVDELTRLFGGKFVSEGQGEDDNDSALY